MRTEQPHPDHLQEYSEGNSHFFTLNNDSYCEVRIDEQTLVLEGITVAPDQQGQGVGSKLLQLAEHYAKKHGCTEIIGDVHEYEFGDNPSDFYRKHGYAVHPDGTIQKHV